MPLFFEAVRALVMHQERKQGTGTGTFISHGRFRCTSLFRGNRSWNSRIEYLSASTAAPTLFLRQESNSSSTTNNSRTTPSAASSAKQNARGGASGSVPRLVLPVRCAGRRLRFRSNPLRAGRCCAGAASRSSRSQRLNLAQCRIKEKAIAHLGWKSGPGGTVAKLGSVDIAHRGAVGMNTSGVAGNSAKRCPGRFTAHLHLAELLRNACAAAHDEQCRAGSRFRQKRFRPRPGRRGRELPGGIPQRRRRPARDRPQ